MPAKSAKADTGLMSVPQGVVWETRISGHPGLSGFFSVDDVGRFQAELLLANRRLGCGRKGGPLTINDISGMAIQSQDGVARWSAFLADPAHRSRRLGV